MRDNVAQLSVERRQPSRQLAAALFFIILLAVGPFMHPIGGQQVSRYALTAAVWDHGTFELNRYSELFFRDGAVRDRVIYSDKAPGQSLIGVPFYGVFRLLGGDPLSADASEPDFGLWWLTVWVAGVPAALLGILMYRWALELQPDTALASALTMSFGTLLLVYGTLLFAHVLAALLAFSMFLLIRKPYGRSKNGYLLAAGALGGLAVLTEYPLVLIVAILTAAAFVLHRRKAWLVVVGGVPIAIVLALYNWQLFGSPFVLSYQWNAFSGVRDEAGAPFEIFAGPSIERFVDVLVSERGLFVGTPVVLLGLAGIFLLWRRGWPVDAIVAALSFLAMLSIQFAWSNSYAGGPGPRYVTPGLPYLVGPLALAWRRWRLPTAFLASLGVLTMVSATVTIPQLGSGFDAGMADWLRTLFAGRTAPTLYTEFVGQWGWAVHAITVALAIVWLYRAAEDDKHDARRFVTARTQS